MTGGADTAQPEPSLASSLFGERLALVRTYVDLLAGAGVERGLLGPRELPVLWDRHLINCAVLSEVVPPGSRVVDVGSGAGLPGLVLALRRPDLRVDLVEPLERRSVFLSEAVEALHLSAQVRVVRGRAESAAVRAEVGDADVVTSRAVAALDRLVGWSLPLVRSGGVMAALKGERAEVELVAAAAAIARLGGTDPHVVQVGPEGARARVVVMTKSGSVGTRKGRRR